MRPLMNKALLALAALLASTAASAEMLIGNVNGIQVGPDGHLQHFGSLLIGDDGRVKQVMTSSTPRMRRLDHMIDASASVLSSSTSSAPARSTI